MSSFKNLFTPLTFGRVTTKNRIEFAPAGACLGTPEGWVSRELIEWTRALAQGGAGVVTIGDSAVDYEYAPTMRYGLNLGDDRVMAGLAVLVETIQSYGAKASIEINHGGRLSPPRLLEGRIPISASPLPPGIEVFMAEMEGRKLDWVPVEMTQADIDTVVGRFADAAYRCLQAGMEMVMIHGGHGHLIAQFASPFSNKRTDRYGGSLENRARFAREVLDAIRRKVGDRLAIEYRISGDELVPGGMHVEETLEFARLIQDRIDLLHVSAGGVFEATTIPRMSQPTYYPHGMNVPFGEFLRRGLKIPVTTVGSITMDMAERIIAEGKADMVAIVRGLLADPFAPEKARRGLADRIRPCVRCDLCGSRSSVWFPVRCAVNPRNGREAEFLGVGTPPRKKKVVVAGGGPAGMEAARAAASRGHEVILLEKGDKLGGALLAAAAAPFKEDMKNYLDWAVRTTMASPGLTVKLNTAATADIVRAERPDALVVAIGGTPFVPDLPGMDGGNVVWAGDVDTGRVTVGETVVVAGAGLTGCETALHLARQGKKVTLIDVLPRIAPDASLNVATALSGLLEEADVTVRTGVKLEAVTESAAVVSDQHRVRTEIPCASVVLALGVRPRTDAVDLGGSAPEVHLVGDCGRTRGTLGKATTDGFNAGMRI